MHGTHRVERLFYHALDILLRAVPDLDDHAPFLVFGQESVPEIIDDARDLLARASHDFLFPVRNGNVLERPGDARARRVLETETLHLVHDSGDAVEAVAHDAVVHDVRKHLLRDGIVDEGIIGREHGVEEEAADRSFKRLVAECRILFLARDRQHLDSSAQVDAPVLIGEDSGIRRGEVAAFPFRARDRLRKPVGTKDDIQGFCREYDHVARARFEEVFIRAHHFARFPLRLFGKRNVDGHLVAVEVRVESGTDQRVKLDGVALDENGPERLDALTVEGRSAVEENVFALDGFFKDFPDLGNAVFDEAACAADVEGELSREKPRNHEGPEKLERHVLRKTALVELEVRADDNDGTA